MAVSSSPEKIARTARRKSQGGADDAATVDYAVGYGNPPEEHRWKPGQSGNPKGRKKQSKNTDTLFWDELDAKVTVTENGKSVKLTKRELVIKQIVNNAVKGDFRSTQLLLAWMRSKETPEKMTEEVPLTAEDEAMLNQLLGRLAGSSKQARRADPEAPSEKQAGQQSTKGRGKR